MSRRSTFLLLAILLVMGTTGLGGAQADQGSSGASLAADGPSAAFVPYFSYYFVAGSSLYSSDYTMRSDYQSGACIAALDTGSQFFTHNLNLPQGARIDFLRLYFYDTEAGTDTTANLRKYDGFGGNVEITTVSSGGSGGFGSTLSGYSGHVVDNSTGAYVLNWWPQLASPKIRLCGLRVAYRLPTLKLYLPLIQR